MLRDQAIAGWTALDPVHVTQAQKDQLASYANQLVVEGVTPPPPPQPGANSATFVTKDVTTKGNWKGAYGAQGYNIAMDAASLPAYAQVSVAGQQGLWNWVSGGGSPDNDVRALQRGTAPGRIAACWYGLDFAFDLNITDGAAHKVALHLMDWDDKGRTNKVDVLDAATQQVLSTQMVQNFQQGVHLVWNVTGHVLFRVTVPGGGNAVTSGIFFG